MTASSYSDSRHKGFPTKFSTHNYIRPFEMRQCNLSKQTFDGNLREFCQVATFALSTTYMIFIQL